MLRKAGLILLSRVTIVRMWRTDDCKMLWRRVSESLAYERENMTDVWIGKAEATKSIDMLVR